MAAEEEAAGGLLPLLLREAGPGAFFDEEEEEAPPTADDMAAAVFAFAHIDDIPDDDALEPAGFFGGMVGDSFCEQRGRENGDRTRLPGQTSQTSSSSLFTPQGQTKTKMNPNPGNPNLTGFSPLLPILP